MGNERSNEMSEVYSTTIDAMKQSGNLNLQAWKKLTEIQLDTMTQVMECGTRQWQLVANAKTPADVLGAESGFVSEYATKFMNNARQAMEVLTETQGEIRTRFERLGGFGEGTPDRKSTTKAPEGKKQQVA